jgi:peptide/nickel transport system substrate-binding protein
MRPLSVVWGVGLVVGLALACAPAAPPAAPTGSTTQPDVKLAADQSINVGINNLFANMDPMTTLGTNPSRYGVYESLVGQDDSGKLIPELATEWRQVDEKTWQFKLATNHRWHDGTPVTADDVVFTYARALEPARRSPIVSRMGPINGATKIDQYTVNVTANEADPLLPVRVRMVPILPKAYIERVGDAEFEAKPIGSGPFKVAFWKAQDRITVERNPEHPKVKPTLERITVRFIPEASARIAGLRSGELDAINQTPTDQVDALRSAGFVVVPFNTGYSWGAWMDSIIEGSPTRDKRVRQAINYAIDKEAIAKVIFKGLTIPEQGQVIQQETFGFNPNLKPYPYDPAKAKQLLAQAGYPNGFTIKLDAYLFNAEMSQVYPFIQAQLKEVGIETQITQYSDSGSNSDRFYGRVARAPITGVSLTNLPALDADFALTWFSPSQQTGGARRYDNAEFDRLFSASQKEMDPKKREKLLQDAVAVMHEDPPYLFLVQGTIVWTHSPKLDNFNKRADGDPPYYKIRKLA